MTFLWPARTGGIRKRSRLVQREVDEVINPEGCVTRIDKRTSIAAIKYFTCFSANLPSSIMYVGPRMRYNLIHQHLTQASGSVWERLAVSGSVWEDARRRRYMWSQNCTSDPDSRLRSQTAPPASRHPQSVGNIYHIISRFMLPRIATEQYSMGEKNIYCRLLYFIQAMIFYTTTMRHKMVYHDRRTSAHQDTTSMPPVVLRIPKAMHAPVACSVGTGLVPYGCARCVLCSAKASECEAVEMEEREYERHEDALLEDVFEVEGTRRTRCSSAAVMGCVRRHGRSTLPW